MSLPLLPVLVDSHCHLDFQNFDPDRMAVVNSARQTGVMAIMNPAVDVDSSRSVVALAQSVPEIYAAVGMHPNEAANWNETTLPIFEELALRAKVVAIGEIGLDYYRDRTPRLTQIKIFEQQLSLAASTGLPVILHNREASQDLLAILTAWTKSLSERGHPLAARPGVLHSFSGDEATAQQAFAMNFYIGITGPVTYRNAADLQNLVSKTPLERMLIETDAPFLTPQPRRGKRNEPAYVRFVAEKIAELHQRPYDEVAQITTANARLLFQIGEKTLA
jgi:TatD DNase family protein